MIRDRDSLLGHGRADVREAALDVADGALADIQPAEIVPNRVERDGSRLRIREYTYDLDAYDRVLVFGAGKGSVDVVEALVDCLGDRYDEGLVVEKQGQGRPVEGVAVFEAGHPIPDDGSLEAGERVLEFVESASSDDLVIACITGGTSALLAAPADALDLADLAATTEVLLNDGAPIDEVNAIRQHLSTVKGGRLADAVAPATLVTLVVVDEPADEPWGPTVPTETTPADAVDVLERRNLRDAVPDKVRDHLQRRASDGTTWEPPSVDQRVVALAGPTDVCDAAVERAEARGLNAMVLSSVVEGESREIGTCFAGIVREVLARRRPVEPPCAFISGGETTVTVEGDAGRGGPNQEFALSFAQTAAGEGPVAALAVGTDGTDGPTTLAGGLVDDRTVERADERGVDIARALADHDAATALRELDDAVYTGATGTNVMDLRVIVVGDPGVPEG
jgi:glycerate-2-kinase